MKKYIVDEEIYGEYGLDSIVTEEELIEVKRKFFEHWLSLEDTMYYAFEEVSYRDLYLTIINHKDKTYTKTDLEKIVNDYIESGWKQYFQMYFRLEE